MFYLEGKAAHEGEHWMEAAAKQAQQSCCLRSRCGAVLVSHRRPYLIGKGYNSPPRNIPLERCLKDADLPDGFRRDNVKTDLSCCVHAEQRALFHALTNHAAQVPGSRMYFVRIDDKGEMLPAGKPWCLVCSKSMYDQYVGEMVLWHKDDVWQDGYTGLCVYGTKAYNELSIDFWRKKPALEQAVSAGVPACDAIKLAR
jgi:deoxycytidylate deaminase